MTVVIISCPVLAQESNSEWQIYQDNGYEIKYPSDWVYEGRYKCFAKYGPEEPVGKMVLATFAVRVLSDNLTLGEQIEKDISDFSPKVKRDKVEKKVLPYNLGGKKAIMVNMYELTEENKFSGKLHLDQIVLFVYIKKDRYIYRFILKNWFLEKLEFESICEKMLKSFRFI